MTLNLIVTGQVRNEESFLRLVGCISESRDRFKSVVLASWSEEVGQVRDLLSGHPLLAEIEFVDCGSCTFGPTISNRDVSSFLAQHQQIACALQVIDTNAHLVRLRADFDPVNSDQFSAFVDLIETIWSDPLMTSNILVFGADDNTPYFFEDRILLLPPNRATALIELSLSAMYRIDYFNLFPEFLFYSFLIGGDVAFMQHDHRFKVRAGQLHQFTKYDAAAFGPRFAQLVLLYLSKIAQSVTFVRDGADFVGRLDLWRQISEGGIAPLNFRIQSMREYSRTWTLQVEQYNAYFEANEYRTWSPQSSAAVIEDKIALNAIHVKYFSGNTVGVLGSSSSSTLFSQEIKEFKGASNVVSGNIAAGQAMLLELFNEGYVGFEQSFYLSRLAALERDQALYNKIKTVFLERYGSIARVVDHLAHLDDLITTPPPEEKSPKRRRRR